MNSMLPLMGRGPQINDPLETAGNAASLSNLLQVNQMRQMQMDEIQRKAAEETEMRKRMERVFKDTEDLYWQREEAKRTQNATTDAPGQYPPGSAQSPIQSADPGAFPVQAESPTATGPGAYRMGQTPPAPVLSVDPASGPDVSAPPAQTVSRDYAKMLGDPDFHRLLAGNAHSGRLTKFAEDATKHALELEKARGEKSPLGKTLSDLEQMGGNAGPDVRDRAISEALKLPQFTKIENGKVVADQVAIDAYNKAHPDRPLVKVQLPSEQKLFENGMKLKQDFMQEPSVKAYAKVKTAFRAVDAAFKNPGPAGDTALATKFMKILDEDSVVRESEFAIALKAAGLWDKASNYASMIISGDKLTPDQRKEFYKIAGDIKDAAESEYNRVGKEYRSIADRHGLDAPMVTGGSLPVEQKIEARKEAAKDRAAKSQNAWTADDEKELQDLERKMMEDSRATQ